MPIRTWPISALVVALTAAWALMLRGARLPAAQSTAAPSAPSQPPEPESVLARRTGRMDFDRVPLETAIDQLSVRTRTTIVVDWTNFGTADKDQSTPVRIGFDDEPLSKALWLLLGCVAPTDPTTDRWSQPMRIWVDGGVVHVGEENLHDIVRMYDAHDLFVFPSDTPTPAATTQSTGLFGPTPNSRGLCRADRRDMVIRVLMDHVAPESWKDAGGSVGVIYDLNDFLLIHQTPECHAELAHVLGHLRAAHERAVADAPPKIGGIDLYSNPAAPR